MEQCSLAAPRSPLGRPLQQRPLDVLPWSVSNLSAFKFEPPKLGFNAGFQPTCRKAGRGVCKPVSEDDDWDAVIKASQHPAVCGRYLAVEDDMLFAGLGFSMQGMASLLLLAVREHRVLIEVPVGANSRIPLTRTRPHLMHGRNTTLVNASTRWCDRPPYTMQCAYAAWTHCTLPDHLMRSSVRLVSKSEHWHHGETATRHLKDHPAAVVHVRTSSALEHLPRGVAHSAAYRHLTRPRPWVMRIAECVMREAGLRPYSYASVFIRNSVEKRNEMALHGHGSPRVSAFVQVVSSLHAMLGWRTVHLQTSDAASYRSFRAQAAAAGLLVGATSNARSSNDRWGGWMSERQLLAGGQDTAAQHHRSAVSPLIGRGSTRSDAPESTPLLREFTVGVVNAHIASLAGALLAPLSSAWTGYLATQMGENTSYWTTTKGIYLCCSCLRLDRYVPHSSKLALGATTRERRANLLLRPHAAGVRWHASSTGRRAEAFLGCALSKLAAQAEARRGELNCTVTRFNTAQVKWAAPETTSHRCGSS